MSILVLVGITLVVVSVVLAVIGARENNEWALFAVNLLWILGAVVAGYFTYMAWIDRVHSENWAMIGVIFFVWPYTLVASVLGTIEFVLLRKRRGRAVAIARATTIACIVFLIAMSVMGLLAG